MPAHVKMYGDLMVFSGTANRPLAEAVAALPEVELGRRRHQAVCQQQHLRAPLHQSVRGKDVFLIQPTSAPVNDNLMELLIFIDTLKRDSAGRITAVVPYYGYGRTDKKDQPRVPITARLVADLIAVAGADRFVTLDLHAKQIQGFFSIPCDELPALGLFVRLLSRASGAECRRWWRRTSARCAGRAISPSSWAAVGDRREAPLARRWHGTEAVQPDRRRGGQERDHRGRRDRHRRHAGQRRSNFVRAAGRAGRLSPARPMRSSPSRRQIASARAS